MGAKGREPRPRAMKPRFWLFSCARPRGIVGADSIDRPLEKALPQCGLVLGRAYGWHHLHQEAVGIEAVDSEIGRCRLDGEMHAGPARGAHDFKTLVA